MATAPSAGQVRAAEQRTNTAPTEAQKRDGSYAKGSFSWHGLKIAVETPKGAERSGVGRDGKRWSVTMPCTYGEISKTEGMDEDPVDCFVGPDLDSDRVFVIDQVDADTKRPDEHKCMLSFKDKSSALAAYEKAFSDGKGRARIGSVTELSVPGFKDWLVKGSTERPMVKQRESLLAMAKKFASGGRVQSFESGGPARELTDDIMNQGFFHTGDIRRFGGIEDEPPAPKGTPKQLAARKAIDDLIAQRMPTRYTQNYPRTMARELASRGREPDEASYPMRQRFADIASDKDARADQHTVQAALGVGSAIAAPYLLPYLAAGLNHPAVGAAALASLGVVPPARDPDAPEASMRDVAENYAPYALPYALAKVAPYVKGAAEITKANPWRVGAGAAGITALSPTAIAQQGPVTEGERKKIESQLERLYQDQAKWETRERESFKRMQDEAFRGGRWQEGLMQKNYHAAKAENDEAKRELSGISPQIKQLSAMNTPEYWRKQEMEAHKQAELLKEMERQKTFQEAHPWGNSMVWPFATALGVGVPWAAKSVARKFENAPVKAMNALHAELQTAIKNRELARVSDLTAQLRPYQDQLKNGTLLAEHGWPRIAAESGAAGVWQGLMQAEGRQFVPQFNAWNLPELDITGQPNQKKAAAWEQVLDPMAYIKPAAPGIVMGALGHHFLPIQGRVQPDLGVVGTLRKYGTTPASAAKAFQASGMVPKREGSPGDSAPPAPRTPGPPGPGQSPGGGGVSQEPVEGGALKPAQDALQPTQTQRRLRGPSKTPTAPENERPMVFKETDAGLHFSASGYIPPGYKAGDLVPDHLRKGNAPHETWKPPHERDKGGGDKGQGAGNATPEKGLGKKIGEDKDGNPIYDYNKPPTGPKEEHAAGGRIANYVKRMLGGRVLTGALHGATGGRADEVKGDVPAGSYVWPADVVAGRGQGNSEAGQKWFENMEKHAMATAGHKIDRDRLHRAAGGSLVKAAVAHGERITPPDVVAAIGNGDIDAGHEICDQMVKGFRDQDIHTLKNLPPPVKS